MHARVCVFQPESDLTIIQLEKRLRQCVETMTKEKQERLKLMKSRMKVDQQLCDALNAIPYYIPTGSVPTDQQLDELEQHIRDLESEQVHVNSTGFVRILEKFRKYFGIFQGLEKSGK